ncbi:MAG: CmpA/NrtA family ABC transporter substrate-binding protein [Hyphomicrobiaceae bacterium]
MRPDVGASKAEVVRIGFIPLLDAAPLIAASELGFARREGVAIELLRETSWATLRDRLAVAHLDAAHILAPIAIADSLGLTPLPVGLVVPMALGTAGNTITVSRDILADLMRHGADASLDPVRGARAFASLVAERRAAGLPPLSLAIVHAYSAHHYQLAYWLAWAGVRPGTDVELVVIPPSLTTAALQSSRIDGFCVGEPWGSLAASIGVGQIVTTSSHIWQRSPDKVLGVRRTFADKAPERTAALVRAVYRAACWCADADNQSELASLLARRDLIGQPADVIRSALARRFEMSSAAADRGGFLSFCADGATLPRRDHGAWFLAQMVRWGQAKLTASSIAAVRETYRPDLFEAALSSIAPCSTASSAKAEVLFDGTPFDPDRIAEYIGGFAVRARDGSGS